MIEARISGYGGQGVILCGMILGKSAALYEDKFSSLSQSFGPEARGSACSAQVIIDNTQILYPYVTNVDVLVAMSQEAFRKFSPDLRPNGVLVYESELVKPQGLPAGVKAFGIPATRIADEGLGRNIFLNVVIVGFIAAVTNMAKSENVKKAVAQSVPEHTIESNLKAFDLGFEYGKKNFA